MPSVRVKSRFCRCCNGSHQQRSKRSWREERARRRTATSLSVRRCTRKALRLPRTSEYQAQNIQTLNMSQSSDFLLNSLSPKQRELYDLLLKERKSSVNVGSAIKRLPTSEWYSLSFAQQ